MNIKNVLIGGIVGGIAFFLLGWVIYGMLLMDYMTSIAPKIEGLWRNESEMLMGIMFLSNLIWGIFIAYIFDLAKISGWMKGMQTAAIVGFLLAVAIDTNYYSMTFMHNKQSMMVDIIASTVLVSIGGAIIGWVMGMLDKKSA